MSERKRARARESESEREREVGTEGEAARQAGREDMRGRTCQLQYLLY